MATTKRQHPSVRFQNGEVRDFNTAMEVYLAQFREEMAITCELIRDHPDNRPGHDAETLRKQTEGLTDVERQVRLARHIYTEIVSEATKRAAATMRGHGDMHLQALADALESGDYSRLAI